MDQIIKVWVKKGIRGHALVIMMAIVTLFMPAAKAAESAKSVKLITHSLKQMLDNQYLNRIKRHLTSPILGQIKITSNFGLRKDPLWGRWTHHAGIDLAATPGTPILAVATGLIRYAGWHPTLGNYVDIEHSPRWRSRYAHARLLYVLTGQHVYAGQFIGQVGSTGRSTGPHLHFEVWLDGQPFNPNRVIAGGVPQTIPPKSTSVNHTTSHPAVH